MVLSFSNGYIDIYYDNENNIGHINHYDAIISVDEARMLIRTRIDFIRKHKCNYLLVTMGRGTKYTKGAINQVKMKRGYVGVKIIAIVVPYSSNVMVSLLNFMYPDNLKKRFGFLFKENKNHIKGKPVTKFFKKNNDAKKWIIEERKKYRS